MENITVYVFEMLEPYLKPLMKTATTQLAAQSANVIDKLDQYEVFHDPLASDPTHSMLSKDHFVRALRSMSQ
jgi:Heterokaryon incompatibility protein Het-C